MALGQVVALVVLGAFALAFAGFTLANRRRRRAFVFGGLAGLCILGSGIALYWSQPAPVPATLSVYYLDPSQSAPTLHALRGRDGQPRWQHDLSGPVYSSFDATAVFVGAQSDRLYLSTLAGIAALNKADGSPLWSFQVENPRTAELCLTPPILTDDTVYLCLREVSSSQLGITIVALGAADGHELWRRHWPAIAVPPAETDFYKPAFAAGAGTLYVALSPTQLLALDAVTGLQRWSVTLAHTPLAFRLDAPLTLVTDATTVYAQAIDGTLTALSATDGATRWQLSSLPLYRDPGEDILGASLTLHGGLLFAVRFQRDPDLPSTMTLFALQRSDGTLAWQRTLEGSWTVPLFFDGDAVCALTGTTLPGTTLPGTTLHSLRWGDGQLLAEASLEASVSEVGPVAVVAVVDGVSFSGEFARRPGGLGEVFFPPITALAAVDARTGRQYWRVSVAPLSHAEQVLVA